MLGHHIKNILLSRGYLLSTLASDNDVRKLLEKLAPHESDKQLIRIGGEDDGGYLVPDDLQGIEYCFSPGVGKTSKFEKDLSNRGIHSFLADYSVERSAVESEMFHFEKKYVGAVNDEIFMTLEHWINKSLPNYSQDLILQMDIEGSEYDVILETPNSVWKMFRVLVVEFHGLQTIFDPYGVKFIGHCFDKLLSTFEIVHIHPNNNALPFRRNGLEIPELMEITFLRKDRVKWRKQSSVFPHPLDHPNVAGRPDVVLPDCWYRSSGF